MSKILVVGGAGYVGSVLVQELLDRGFAVKVFDRLYFGSDGLRDVADRVELSVGDMRSLPRGLLDDVEAVVNVGGLSNDPTAEYNPQANHEMNTVATLTLARHCVQAGVRRYVFASSCSIYDRGVVDEERDVVQDEESDVDPRAAYSGSKYAAERGLLEMASERFCPVLLRKGTIFGFSPRMRFDLVVNSFVKDALGRGAISLHYGGEMWRPLVDVRDAARAYILALQADESLVRGQVFNVVQRNYRIAELALRVRTALREAGVEADVAPDYGYRGVRSYRVSGRKIEQVLGYRAEVSVEDSVKNMVAQLRAQGTVDLEHPRHYNIRWLRLLEEADKVLKVTGSVFGSPIPEAFAAI